MRDVTCAPRSFLAAGVLALLLAVPAIAAQPIPLTEGAYRLGDSPQTLEDGLVWLKLDEGNPGWIAYDPTEGHSADGFNHAWRRFRLPDAPIDDPTFFVRGAPAFELYIDGRLIYKAGEMWPSSLNKVLHHAWHTAPLPGDFAGKYVFLRVYSQYEDAFNRGNAVMIGSERDLWRYLVRSDLLKTVVGSILLIVGLGLLYFHIRRREPATKHLAHLSAGVGLFTVLHTNYVWMVYEPSLPLWYFSHVPLFTFPIGLWLFLDHVMDGRCPILKRLAWLQGIVAVVSLILDLFDIYPMVTSTPYLVVFTIELALGVVATYWHVHHGGTRSGSDRREAKLLGAGFALMMLCAAHDLLAGFYIIPFIVPMFHFGVLAFVLFLAAILERRFAAAHDRLRDYSAQLEEANRTLESRVAERTRDIAEKNDRLETAMTDLRETQNRLVMREKMAAIGDLVAGVAHEINTPIGAVNSSADVAERCIGRLTGMLDGCEGAESLREDRRYQQTVAMLSENTSLIRSAGDRIATIVRSLRNFARLDEAEFKKADIHEGLESTLALVHHQMKNRIDVVREFGDVPPIECFPNQLNQVFMNVLVNASQAIEGTGRITIHTESDATNAVIRITDSGRGIPPDRLERIFDPGYTTKGVGVGTGLGLSISYAIIQEHNGSITAESEIGKGTTFTITLPLRRSTNT